MKVHRVLEFIKSLVEQDTPVSCDAELCESLSAQFSKSPIDEYLNKKDLEFILDCYKSRWDVISDSENDYTFSASSANQLWINFARDLEPIAKRNYLKILIPTVTNDRDFNDFSPLNETVNLFNFYLGYDGTTLYRKFSFCNHLYRLQFVLSTYRNGAERALSIVTVEELARLKLCRETTRKVTIGIEAFENFWDLLRKKVFVHLRDNGQIPLGLLPHLLELVERYYFLKSNGLDIAVFKNDVSIFFQRLYGYELSAVNFLYGTILEYKDAEYYLLDVFIDLHRATNYSELELPIRALSKWLFYFNPILKASIKELDVVYGELLASNNERTLGNNNHSDLFINCCKLLVSLLTTQFDMYPSLTQRTSYSLWDITNEIPPMLGGIFDILIPKITENQPEFLAEVYGQLIKDIITPALKDNSWFTKFTRAESTEKWLTLVKSSRLDELGVHWFEPELLFSSLLLFNSHNQLLKKKINLFLEDLIQTYVQNKSDLMKQFRVNILFNKFLSGLSEHHRIHLLRLINLYDHNTAKSKFIYHCTLYIRDRLAQLRENVPETRSIYFFAQLNKLDSAHLFKLPDVKNNLNWVIADYQNQLMDLRFKFEPKNFETLGNYLFKIGRPILTEEQKEATIRNCRDFLD